jgi:hypothetical protein
VASWGSERPRILALYHCCVVLSDQRTELMGGDVMSWHSAVIKTTPNPQRGLAWEVGCWIFLRASRIKFPNFHSSFPLSRDKSIVCNTNVKGC